MRALVCGGAFNPPTIAHIETARFVKDSLHYDAVIFVPSKMHYIKDEQGKDFAFTDEERLNMLETIAANEAWMKVSRYEIDLPEQPRTYLTLCHLRDEGYTCSLLFGSDKLAELETGWRYIDEIMHEFGVVCMKRNHDDVRSYIHSDPYLKQYEDCITVVDTPDLYQDISSTKVRKLYRQILAGKEELRHLVPQSLDGLNEYISKAERK